MKTAIVLLYGLYGQKRPNFSKYQQYLDFVAQDTQAEKTNQIMLCGGFTDPNQPGISEASSAREYLAKILPHQTFILEDKSITSNQNLEFAAQLINNKQDQLIVYCDQARKAKIIWMSLHFLLHLDRHTIYSAILRFTKDKDPYKDFNHANLTVKGFELSGDYHRQTYGSMLSVMGVYDKESEAAGLEQRKDEFGLS